MARRAGRDHYPQIEMQRPSIAFVMARPRPTAAELHGAITHREPYPSLQHCRLSRLYWYYTSDHARTELGYCPRPFTATLEDAHAWACDTGNLKRSGQQRDGGHPQREAA